MNRRVVMMVAIFVVFFGGVNYYTGLRGWQWLQVVAPQWQGWAYWIPFWIVGFAFLLPRLTASWLPRPLISLLTVIGSYWLAVLQYAVPLLLLIDVGRGLNYGLKLIPGSVMQDPAFIELVGWITLLLTVSIVLHGIWSAKSTVVTKYEIVIPKSGGRHKELHIVLASDLHVGVINGNRRLQHLVKRVNGLEPDLILLAGDIIDDDFHPFIAHNMAAQFKKLKSKLGVYSVLGNHEYIAGHLDEYRLELEKAGVQMLLDEAVKVDDSFYVMGRDDISGKSLTGRPRMAIGTLMQDVDVTLPLILMDHQPSRLDEAQQAGIDLQVSGHTHRGQMFPYHHVTRRLYELDWGYLHKEKSMHTVVSSGFGTWGPPVRVGHRGEIVSIKVTFRS